MKVSALICSVLLLVSANRSSCWADADDIKEFLWKVVPPTAELALVGYAGYRVYRYFKNDSDAKQKAIEYRVFLEIFDARRREFNGEKKEAS